ncbi:aromatic ring-hydroxylating dioxygenase subunit alpha, partial [Alicyclobacillaceae bacterium I2511]
MIRKAWYAVCQGDSVREQPIKVTVHGQDFVIFRDSQGTLHAFHAYCPHRGCDLSLGTWDHEELQCPFHGWRFNTKGACVHIPANLRGSRAPARSALPSYPVAEHAALVWIYTLPHVEDTQSMPEFVTFPELNQPEWAVSFFDVTWQAHFTRVVESVLDVSHLPFVHPDTTGDVVPVVDGPECSVRDRGIKIHPSPFAP